MSAALQIPQIWAASAAIAARPAIVQPRETTRKPAAVSKPAPVEEGQASDASLAFYRKHTEKLLRRYLYASMQVGRAPSVLGDSVGRGWVSSRPVRSFEDAVIFVLDVESCLNRLSPLDRAMLTRVILQEYTYTEAAHLLGMANRTLAYKLPMAIDRLTRLLLDSRVLILPR